MASDEKTSAAALKVLSAGAVKRGVAKIAEAFERSTGSRVTVEFATGPEVRKRIEAGETADVIVAPPAIMDEFAKAGRIAVESRGFVGRSRMGVVVHASASKPCCRWPAKRSRTSRPALQRSRPGTPRRPGWRARCGPPAC